MPTYIYESIPEKKSQKPRRFELVQSMKDAPLTRDPETGEPVRRVITGGFGVLGRAQGFDRVRAIEKAESDHH